MNRLDRIISDAAFRGDVKFSSPREADYGHAHLVKQSGNDKWHLCITSGEQVRLGWLAQKLLDMRCRGWVAQKRGG